MASKVVNTFISGRFERYIFTISGHGCSCWPMRAVAVIETVGYVAAGNADQNWGW